MQDYWSQRAVGSEAGGCNGKMRTPINQVVDLWSNAAGASHLNGTAYVIIKTLLPYRSLVIIMTQDGLGANIPQQQCLLEVVAGRIRRACPMYADVSVARLCFGTLSFSIYQVRGGLV